MAQDEAGEVKRGRPKLFDGCVSVRLTAAQHDALSREAIRQGRDLSDVIRARLFVSQKTRTIENDAQ
jgi:hypothetical protein